MDLKVRSTAEYKNISSQDTLTFLQTSVDGLTESEVGKRLEIFGYKRNRRAKKESSY